MHREGDRFPVRQATRLVNEFQFAVTPIGLAMADRHLDLMVVLMLVFRHALRPNASPALSMHAIATSLNRPVETIRRHVGALAALGYCHRHARSMRLAEQFHHDQRVLDGGARLVALFGQLLDGFEQTGFTLASGVRARSDRAVTIAALDIYLSTFELGETRLTNTLNLYVTGAISVRNAAAITHDPVLAERYGYADTVPPPDLRRPVSMRAIAAIDGLPYASIWRHVTAAERAGVVRRTPESYLLGDRWIDSGETSERSRVKIRYVKRVLSDLASSRLS